MNKKHRSLFTSWLGVIFLVLFVLVSVVLAAYEEKPKSVLVAEGNTAFALDLYQELKDARGNIFFSPYSISTALAMTYAGARGNTAKQMADVLHFTLDQNELHPAFARLEALLNEVQTRGDLQLHVANSLWPQEGYPFLKEYLALVKKHYGVAITPLDYQGAAEEARKIINQWVEEKTKDRIKNLIQPGVLDALTRLVLTNAIYFKGNWASQFDEKRTQEDTFYLLSGKTIRTPLMAQDQEFAYSENEFLQVLELPYVGETLSMLVLLPKKNNGLPELEKQLAPGALKRWTTGLKKQKVKVFLPKFKMTSQFSLAKTLASMGMDDAFALKADFSGMDGRKWLYIGAVIHKAFVDVNEEGTEAAAATAVVMRIRMARPTPPPTFRADHPFIFLIRENTTRSILFMGRVLDPTQKGE
ncbi:MAG: serpin family protein [Candidatus Aminicenantes bacterium]|nr:MAG: serpin family protein [Candidatus Aminicenantes bacterium]